MSGKYDGVQARLLQTVRGEMYVSLQISLFNFSYSNDKSVRNVMLKIQEVAFSYDYSAKNTRVLP